MPVEIVIFYGPYEANGIIRHKKQRLYGLNKKLEELQYKVNCYPSPNLDRLVIKMLGREIIRCKVRSLKFNTVYEEDEFCQKLIDEIEFVTTLFITKRNVPTIKVTSVDNLFGRQEG